MRYMLLIYTDESANATMSAADGQAIMTAYYAYDNATKAAGVHQLGEALESIAQAKTVRVRNGKAVVTDGPYAETKEQLGGFYTLECKDLDEAILWASQCPGLQSAPIEIRPLVDYNA